MLREPPGPPKRQKTEAESSLPRRSFLGQLTGVPLAAAGIAHAATFPAVQASEVEQAPEKTLSGSARPGGVGKTTRVDGEVKEYRDSDTGARVVQLTGDGSDNVHLYFTSPSFLGDGAERIVFGSNRSGRVQFYLLEIRDRRLVQLTNAIGIDGAQRACLAPTGRLFYFDGSVMHSLKVDTQEDRELYRVPRGFRPHLATCTANGEFVAFAYGEDLTVSTETGRLYSSMSEVYYQRPSSVIMRIKASDGQPVAAWGDRMWISHVLIHPRQPDLILFCHEGGSLSQQRMWTVDLAVERNRRAVALYQQNSHEYCVHEYWTNTGDVGFQYELDREGRREHYNCFVRPDGTWLRQYLLPGSRPGHIQSNSTNTLVVGDCGYLSPADRDGQNFISLMTNSDGLAHVRRLCRRHPGPTEESHGHPVFSSDDRWVLFNSRIGERDNIFMADVGSI
jgi:oligogalacturonide lyase